MVLSLALHLRAGGDDVEVVLDERKGRRAAAALGLSLVGTAGLVLRRRPRACSPVRSRSGRCSTRWNERACTWGPNCERLFWRPLMSSPVPRLILAHDADPLHDSEPVLNRFDLVAKSCHG